jgi:hypothetical protein
MCSCLHGSYRNLCFSWNVDIFCSADTHVTAAGMSIGRVLPGLINQHFYTVIKKSESSSFRTEGMRR